MKALRTPDVWFMTLPDYPHGTNYLTVDDT